MLKKDFIFFKNLNIHFKNIFYIIYFDLIDTKKNLMIIYKKNYYIIIFFIFLFIIQFLLFFFFIVYFFSFLFFFFKFIYIFIWKKNYVFSKNNPFIYKYSIKDSLYNKTIKIHLYYYFFYLPNMKAFQSVYLFFKNIYNKNEKIPYFFIFLFILIIIPIRFLIKFLTSFSYLAIKISSQIVENYIDIVENYSFDNYSAVLDNILLDIDTNYFFSLKNTVINYKIYFDKNNIIFNPLWYEHFFKNIDSLKKSMFHANNLFKIRFVETKNIMAHPIFISKLNFKDSKELTMVYQSSNIIRPILSKDGNLTEDSAIVSVDRGALGKVGVHNFRPVTVDLSKNELKITNISTWKTYDLPIQKKIALKAIYLSFYKKDLEMEYGKIVEGVKYDYYIHRLFELYDSKQLSLEAKEAMSYILDFTQEHIKDDQEKIVAWEFLLKTCIISENGEVFFPDFAFKDLPPCIQNMIDN